MMSTLSTPSGREISSRGQPLVSRVEHGVQHGLGDDDVHLVHSLRKGDLLHLASDDGHHVVELVVLHNLLRVVHDGAHVNSNDHLSTSLGCEHGENASTAADVEDNLALEKMLVVPHGVAIGKGSHLIFQHLLMYSE